MCPTTAFEWATALSTCTGQGGLDTVEDAMMANDGKGGKGGEDSEEDSNWCFAGGYLFRRGGFPIDPPRLFDNQWCLAGGQFSTASLFSPSAFAASSAQTQDAEEGSGGSEDQRQNQYQHGRHIRTRNRASRGDSYYKNCICIYLWYLYLPLARRALPRAKAKKDRSALLRQVSTPSLLRKCIFLVLKMHIPLPREIWGDS